MMRRAMASAENVAAGARAVFFSIAYPDPQDGFATEDAASVFAQLGALFHAARAISNPTWLGSAAEHADGEVALPEPKPAQEPRVRRIHMDWRHIEVATELPWDFINGFMGSARLGEAMLRARNVRQAFCGQPEQPMSWRAPSRIRWHFSGVSVPWMTRRRGPSSRW